MILYQEQRSPLMPPICLASFGTLGSQLARAMRKVACKGRLHQAWTGHACHTGKQCMTVDVVMIRASQNISNKSLKGSVRVTADERLLGNNSGKDCGHLPSLG